MWDIQNLCRENNLEAIRKMMGGAELDQATTPPAKDWPLSLLATKMKIGPPVISEIMQGLTDIDTLTAFLALIRAFVPDHEDDILEQPRSLRVRRFCYHFEREHFPLPAWGISNPAMDFVRNLPVDLMAMSYDAYHDMGFTPGYTMLLSLVVYPYWGDERDEYEPGNPFEPGVAVKKEQTLVEVFGGARIPLLDVTGQIVGRQLVRQIPAAGWQPKELHRITDGTVYEGVGHFADWACSQTGCVVLDNNYSDCQYQEGMGDPIFLWTKYNVKRLTADWPKVQEYRRKIDHIVEWLEADPPTRFGELLNELLKHPPKQRKGGKPNYDDTEHWVQLEQGGYMYDDDEHEGDEVNLARVTIEQLAATPGV